jgi:hypothetical protein
MTLIGIPDVESSAWISDCGRYRYSLLRRWALGPLATFIMLNPSTADADQDDPTIRRCIGFARRWDCGGLFVMNLYALRSTDPRGLWLVDDPIGPQNDDMLANVVELAQARRALVIAAWGANAPQERVDQVLELPGMDHLQALGVTQTGAPKHPLARGRHRIPDDTVPCSWPPREQVPA